MYDQIIHVIVSALVFAWFVPGVFVTIGGKQYSLLVHAGLFAVTHYTVRHFLDRMLATVSLRKKGLYGEDGHGTQRKGLYGEDGHGRQRKGLYGEDGHGMQQM
jgi:hypothetical protein